MDELSDATSIVSAWFSGDTESPTDSDAMLEWVVEQNTSILVVDDVHLLDQRHRVQVAGLLNGLHERGKRSSSPAVFRYRSPWTGPRSISAHCPPKRANICWVNISKAN